MIHRARDYGFNLSSWCKVKPSAALISCLDCAYQRVDHLAALLLDAPPVEWCQACAALTRRSSIPSHASSGTVRLPARALPAAVELGHAESRTRVKSTLTGSVNPVQLDRLPGRTPG
jgi:hypothetical protein